MMNIDKLQREVTAMVAKVAIADDPLEGLLGALIALRIATKASFVARYGDVNQEFHAGWTRRVGTPGYDKATWLALCKAISMFAGAVATDVGYEGPWVPRVSGGHA